MAEHVGRYALTEVIGVGSFATVHRAVDTHLNDVVVVKILAENHSLNPEVRERFISEGRSLRRVQSPHVVTIHDIGESDRQQPYLVLSYADRGTLAERVNVLRAQGLVPGPPDVLRTARSLAAAIEAVHRADLVHRDLSPGNVLLTSVPVGRRDQPGRRGGASGQVAGPEAVWPGEDVTEDAVVVAADERLVVADLGMCKDLAMNSGLTVAGGTSGFRPPEQEGPGLIDTRADLWAMSRLLLWMCEGAEAALPPELFTALRRSTATDPADRHPDVGAWLAEIETTLAPEPPAPGSPLPEDTAPPAAIAPDGRHVAVSGAASAAGGASAAAPEAADSAPKGFLGKLRRRWRVALAGLAAVALLAGATFLIGLQAGSDVPSQSGESAIAIEGPNEVAVGQEATFTALIREVDDWVWTLPTGAHVIGEPVVSITASSPGPAHVVLRSRAPDGTDLEVIHSFRVSE